MADKWQIRWEEEQNWLEKHNLIDAVKAAHIQRATTYRLEDMKVVCCSVCGSIVMDETTHARWHIDMGQL